jgi:hypothetical protein
MSSKWILLPLIVGVGLSACATLPTGPTVMALPGHGRTLAQFEADDLACRQWAEQRTGTPGAASEQSMATSAAAGTVLGAGLGAGSGAAAGNPAAGAAIGAGSGLLGGTAVGLDASRAAVGTVQWQYDVAYEQCMYAKGNQIPVIMHTPQPGYAATLPQPPTGAPTATTSQMPQH